jgi:type II secretory pathway component PulK
MGAELAASIVDWRDADDEVTSGGAESEYYLLLADPYYCKNAPFETLDELLLVKGATRDLLFMSNNGYEYALALLAVSVSLLVSGAGRLSVDAALAGGTASTR